MNISSKNQKHTPGPWIAKYGITQRGTRKWRGGFNTASFVWVTTADEKKHITTVTRTESVPGGFGESRLTKSRAEKDANALLIAAAPELLKALECAVLNLRGGSKPDECYLKFMEQAIAKAKGE